MGPGREMGAGLSPMLGTHRQTLLPAQSPPCPLQQHLPGDRAIPKGSTAAPSAMLGAHGCVSQHVHGITAQQ